MVNRFDVSEYGKPKKTAQGYLRADALPTRAGVFVYTYGNGEVVRELRHPDEVFSVDSLASLELAPLTDDHPSEPLNPDNTKALAVGNVGENVRRDGDNVRASVLVTDSAAIAKVEARSKTQLSCGYSCDVVPEQGVWNGQKYDAKQINIRYNHVALVDRGRAGPGNSIKMDSAGVCVFEQPGTVPAKETTLIKVRIDGVDYDASEQAAQAFAKFEASVKADAEKAAARADALKADLEKTRGELSDVSDPQKRADAVRERVALERTAEKAGVEKADGISDDEIRKAVIGKVRPEVKTDGKDPAYVAALFDICCEDLTKKQAKNDGLAKVQESASVRDDVVDFEKIKADHAKSVSALWKQPLSANKGKV